MSVPLSWCLVPTSAFLSLRTNTERVSMKSAGGNLCHGQMNCLHFGWNCTRDKGAGYDRKFESTSNWCCHVAASEWLYINAAVEASHDWMQSLADQNQKLKTAKTLSSMLDTNTRLTKFTIVNTIKRLTHYSLQLVDVQKIQTANLQICDVCIYQQQYDVSSEIVLVVHAKTEPSMPLVSLVTRFTTVKNNDQQQPGIQRYAHCSHCTATQSMPSIINFKFHQSELPDFCLIL